MRKSLFSTIKLIFSASKGYAALCALVAIVTALITPAQVAITRATVAIASGETAATSAGIAEIVAFWAGLRLVQALCGHLNGYSTQGISLAAEAHWSRRLMKAIGASRYELYDDPTFYKDVQLSQQQTAQVFSNSYTNAVQFCASVVGVIVMSAMLWEFSPWAAVVSVLSCVPGFIYQDWFGRKNWDFTKELQSDVRKINYSIDVCMIPAAAKDNRLLGLNGWLMRKFDALSGGHTNLVKAFNRKYLGLGVFTALIHAVGTCGVVAWGVLSAIRGSLTIAAAIATVAAASGVYNQVQGIVVYRNMIKDSLRGCAHNFGLLKTLEEAPKREAAHSTEAEAVRFENVSFGYKGKDKYAVEGVSFSISHGETVAIVGENGAGKSTLALLLAGLYHPSEGRIYIKNGASVTCFMQDFRVFGFTVAENLRFGDLSSPADEARLNAAASDSGLSAVLASRGAGYESYVGRDYAEEGLILSGGETSRIAIARAFYAGGPIVVMDEPNAALDVKAEEELFGKLFSLSQNRATVYITHRLANVVRADRILVMKDGRLIVNGPHAQIMRECEHYRELFNAQAKLYAAL